MKQTKQLNEYTEVELKALAFDLIGNMERIQHDLRVINEELAKRNSVASNTPAEAPKKK